MEGEAPGCFSLTAESWNLFSQSCQKSHVFNVLVAQRTSKVVLGLKIKKRKFCNAHSSSLGGGKKKETGELR